MRKKLQYLLVFIFLCHSFVTITKNIFALETMKHNLQPQDFNSLGRKIMYKINGKFKFPKVFDIYSNFSGIEKGYGYYAPNMFQSKLTISFSDGEKEIHPKIYMKETEIKYETMMKNILLFSKDSISRNQYVTSISYNLLNNIEEVPTTIKLNISIQKITSRLEYEIKKERYKTENIEAYSIFTNKQHD